MKCYRCGTWDGQKCDCKDGQTIFHGDCRELLPTLDGVSLVITSPPYNLGGSRGTQFSRLKTGYKSYRDNLTDEDYIAWQQGMLRDCWGALLDNGAIFYNHKFIAKGNVGRNPTQLVPPDIPIRQVIIWDRGSGFQRTLWHFVPRTEWIILMAKEGYRLSTLIEWDLWHEPATSDTHPASFPLAIPTRAIQASGNDGPVLDPFLGSGTTLVACKDLGRQGIGIELEEQYCEIAANRLRQEVLAFSSA